MFLNKCSVCVFNSLRDCDQVWLWNYNRFRVLHAVNSLNVKHDLRSKKIKLFCIMQTFPDDISWFATWRLCLTVCMNLKQRSSDVTGRPLVSDITEGVIRIWSYQMKFRLKKKKTSFNPFVPGNFGEKGVLKLVKPFSSHCLAIKS